MLRQIIEQHIAHVLHRANALTLLSDRQKGLLEGVERVFPASAHGYCLKHLEDNLRKHYKHPELKNYLWKAARATTESEFNDAIMEMRQIDNDAVNWLLDHASPTHWAEIYFPGKRYGHLTSNIAESLNAWLLRARELPILAMFETIRQQLMDWFTTRRLNECDNAGATLAGANIADLRTFG